jgi:molybdenum cofactor cytidylyltransferase
VKKSALQIEAIVLAAGSSSRFGADKRLFLVEGVPMLQRAIAAVVDAVNSVTIVLKSSDRDTLPQLLGAFFADKRVILQLLDKPEAGMGSNLAQAVANLPAACDGVLVMLADMPYVQSQTVQAVINAYEDEKIVAPVYFGENGAEQRGHPVLFAKQFFSELALLAGDVGARFLLRQYASSVISLRVSDAGILRDIDAPTI